MNKANVITVNLSIDKNVYYKTIHLNLAKEKCTPLKVRGADV